MATAVSSAPAAPVGTHPAPPPSSASPILGDGGQNAVANGSITPGADGLRLDMRTSNGAQRDGRVRNPIPSKLKGKTDKKKGNFNVMHMDISNTAESQARYDAAKRNSENTALQAKLAETDHYVSHHRRANYSRTKPPPPPPPPPKDSQPLQTSPNPSPNIQNPQNSQAPQIPPNPQTSQTPTPPAPLPPPPPRSQALSPEETKAEQARLLTLLRTLPHANIVDQLCKALAFFGGIPDAPPPQDGRFPESGEANGPGSLFVGWISEIFPDLDRPVRPVITLSAPPKRPRGRPKGSKGTKARRDKGIKKGAKMADGANSSAQAADHQNGEEDGWVDVDDSVMDVDRQGDTVEDRVLSLLRTPPQALNAAAGATPTAASTGFTSINPAATETASSGKKRGRPKGSKNRPKDPGAQEAQQGQQAAASGPTTSAIFQPSGPPITGTPTTGGSAKKPAGARSKGGKKSKAGNESTPHSATPAQQNAMLPAPTSTSYIPPPTLPMSATRPSAAPIAQPAIVNGGGNKNKRTHLPLQTSPTVTPAIPQPMPQVKESTITGAKRKRQSNKAAGKETNMNTSSDPVGSSTILPQSVPSISPNSTVQLLHQPQAQAVEASSVLNIAAPPPAKRPRKSNAAASKRQSAAATTGENDSSLVSAVNSIPAQQMAPSNAPAQAQRPVEGLDAHYERFASFQNPGDQNQGYAAQPNQSQSQATVPGGVHGSASASAEGLDAHYERFAALQNQTRQQATQQNNSGRQQARQHQQPVPQSASPTSSQISKTPQVSSLPSQQQPRAASNTPNYYAQNQTPAYTVQQASYTTNQRQPQSTSTGSPGAALVSHVTHSPQYASQSNNSPLLGPDNSFRGSPSLGFAPRRTPSASPMDNNYRPSAVPNQSQHFGTPRQTPTSHSGVPTGFQSFSDSGFLDLQGFDSSNTHNGMGLGNAGPYISTGNVQRAGSGSNNASAYTNATITNGAYDSSGLNKGTMNNGYRGQARWS
jgi:hypothetical protein